MKMTKKILRKLIFEALGGDQKVTPQTTVAELLSMGYVKQSQIDSWNKKVQRGVVKIEGEATQERANQAVAFFLGMTYAVVPAGVEFHEYRGKKDEQGKKYGFGLKPAEKALIAYGISRPQIEAAFRHLVSAGALTNNKDEISNNAHMRHGRLQEFLDTSLDQNVFVDDASEIEEEDYFISAINVSALNSIAMG